MKTFCSLAAVMLLAASAAPALAQDAPPANAPPQESAAPAAEVAPPAPQAETPAEVAPTQPTDGRIGPAPKDRGQVIFFRPGKYAGALLSFSVHDGDKGVGKLGNGSYFVDFPAPGSHTYTIQSEAKDSLTLEIDAGETYYVKQTIGMGIMVGRPHLAPSDQTEFERAHTKLSTKKPTDVKAKT